MKKLLLVALSFFAITFLFAGSADLFKIDEVALEEEFASLTALEEVVKENDYISLNEIQRRNLYDVSAFNFGNLGEGFADGEFVFQWEGFLWGFCCCLVGFFVVAVNKNKDKDQKTSYWIGVAVSVALNAISSLLTPTYYYY